MFGTNGTDENFRLFHLFQSASERAISQVKIMFGPQSACGAVFVFKPLLPSSRERELLSFEINEFTRPDPADSSTESLRVKAGASV